ncbi:MAG: hypothetical protein ACLGI6_02585 [Gammaproteobacteria bacterium]
MQRDYELIGRFIYGATRHGAEPDYIGNWIADDLGVSRPVSADHAVLADLFDAFCARYPGAHEREQQVSRFIDSLAGRGAAP